MLPCWANKFSSHHWSSATGLLRMLDKVLTWMRLEMLTRVLILMIIQGKFTALYSAPLWGIRGPYAEPAGELSEAGSKLVPEILSYGGNRDSMTVASVGPDKKSFGWWVETIFSGPVSFIRFTDPDSDSGAPNYLGFSISDVEARCWNQRRGTWDRQSWDIWFEAKRGWWRLWTTEGEIESECVWDRARERISVKLRLRQCALVGEWMCVREQQESWKCCACVGVCGLMRKRYTRACV